MTSVRLAADAYQRLRAEVLERDGWRCQRCGDGQHLDVHHLCPRGRGGADHPANLITLCRGCHRAAHRGISKEEDGDGEDADLHASAPSR